MRHDDDDTSKEREGREGREGEGLKQRHIWLIQIADERVGVQVKRISWEHMPYLSASEVMIHKRHYIKCTCIYRYLK